MPRLARALLRRRAAGMAAGDMIHFRKVPTGPVKMMLGGFLCGAETTRSGCSGWEDATQVRCVCGLPRVPGGIISGFLTPCIQIGGSFTHMRGGCRVARVFLHRRSVRHKRTGPARTPELFFQLL